MKTKEKIEAKIEKLQKKLKELETPKLEKGKWYIASCAGVDGYLILTSNVDKCIESECWFTKHGAHINGRIGSFSKIIRLATDSEVESALIKEAKRRGYKKGNFKSLIGHCDDTFNGWYFSLEDNVMYSAKRSCGGMAVFKDGKWAEIIESKVTINGYDMEVNGNEVKFGCAKFNRLFFKEAYYSLLFMNGEEDEDGDKSELIKKECNRRVKSITLDSGVEITVEQLKQICDELN